MTEFSLYIGIQIGIYVMYKDGLNDLYLPLTKHYSGDEIVEGEIGGGGGGWHVRGRR